MESCKKIVSTFLFALCRSPVKEALAEFMGTFFLVLCGDGVMASITLGRLGQNATLVAAFGWGLSLGIGIWISGRVSGGHLNPAVTTALAAVRKCPWKNVFPYLVAQYLASFIAASVVYLVYRDGIADFDFGTRQLPPSINSTAQIFSTYPQDSASIGTLFFDQVVGTCLLLIIICTATDARMERASYMQPLIIGLGLTVIALAFGYNCGAPLNPARDLGPRLFTAVSGWGFATFSFRSYKWFWIPIVAPHVGALLGVLLYDFFIDMPFRKYALLVEDSENFERDEEDRLPKVATTTSKPSMRQVLERSFPSSDYTGKSLETSKSPEKDRTSSGEMTLNEGFIAKKTDVSNL